MMKSWEDFWCPASGDKVAYYSIKRIGYQRPPEPPALYNPFLLGFQELLGVLVEESSQTTSAGA